MIDNRLRNRREAGFTLIELLVVVVVIGILIAIAIPLYLHYEQGAYDASAKSDLRTLRLEERTYNVNNPDSFGTAADLHNANNNLVMSDDTIGTVLWANANGFCAVTINTKGKQDDNSVLKAYGLPPYVPYFYDSTTAQVSTQGCTNMNDRSGLNGYFDSAGWHAIS